MPNIEIDREKLLYYLQELAKEYKKSGGKYTPADITLFGGGSVLLNYGFRSKTTDADAIIQSSSVMKDAIRTVADNNSLPYDWINTDFKKTESYSPKLERYSKYYKDYYHVLTVRTISDEYLVAMKLISGRQYKSDMSDIIGIIKEHKERDNPLTIEMIKKAFENLYDDWDKVPTQSLRILEIAINSDDLTQTFNDAKNKEMATYDKLITFQEKYPGVLNQKNINDIIDDLMIDSEPNKVYCKAQTPNGEFILCSLSDNGEIVSETSPMSSQELDSVIDELNSNNSGKVSFLSYQELIERANDIKGKNDNAPDKELSVKY